jgi:hypothetical protein
LRLKKKDVSLLFSEEQVNDHCNGLSPVEKKGRLDISGIICSYREALSKAFYVDRSSLFFINVEYIL